MMAGDRVLGVMSVQSYTTPRAYDEHDRNLLTALASQTAIALQNARLFEQLQTRARREQVLREITAHVRGSTDPDTIVRAAVRELGAALGRPAFVRLGSAEQLCSPASVAGRSRDGSTGSPQQPVEGPQTPAPPTRRLRADKGNH
jgi:GAF domain-containing protein